MALYRQKGSKFYWVSIYRPGKPRLRMSTGLNKIEEARMIEMTLRQAQRRESSGERLVGVIHALLGTSKADEGIPLLGIAEAAQNAARAAGQRPVSEWTGRHRKAVCARLDAWAKEHCPRASTMQTIDRMAAFAFADYLLTDGAGAKTRLNIISELGTLWRLLMPRTGIADNPWAMVRPKSLDGKHGRAFTPAEETAILKAAKQIGHDWFDVCQVARYTGLRYGDVAHLKWSEVDLPGGRFTLKPSKTARHGIELGLPIHPSLAKALGARTRDVSGWVFPGHATEYKAHQCGLHPFTDVLKAAGITDGKPEGVTFHSFRHTFRTRLSESGASQEVAMTLGGWSRAETAGRYSHDWEKLNKAVRALA